MVSLSKHTHTHAQCSHTSVRLVQAHPNKHVADIRRKGEMPGEKMKDDEETKWERQLDDMSIPDLQNRVSSFLFQTGVEFLRRNHILCSGRDDGGSN